jgi:3-keto-disaccharide hydrolase
LLVDESKAFNWLASLLLISHAAVSFAASPPSTLTDAERQAGWKLLFDGKTTTGWRGYKMDKMPPGWAVIDGVLTRVKGGAGGIMRRKCRFSTTPRKRRGASWNSRPPLIKMSEEVRRRIDALFGGKI